MNSILTKAVMGIVALAGAGIVVYAGRQALYGSDKKPEATEPVREITAEEVHAARAEFENHTPTTVRAVLADISGSVVDPPSRTCRRCKGMRSTLVAKIRDVLRDFFDPKAAPPARTHTTIISLGSGSFGASTYRRSVEIDYERMPEPPEKWGSTDPLALTPAQLVEIDRWRSQFRSWRTDMEQHGSKQRAAIEAAIVGIEKHPSEWTTDIVSATEAAALIIPPGASAVHLTYISDFEEILDGRRRHHTDAELAAWCTDNEFAFPEATRVTAYVSTTAGTLQGIQRRWKPFFTGCGVKSEAIRFLPLHTVDPVPK